MTKKKIELILVSVVMLGLFNVIAFVAPFEMNAVFWVSYIFSMVAILVQLPAVVFAFSGDDSVKSKFYGFPIARISVTYLFVQVILGIIFMAVSQFVPAWIPTIAFAIILAVSAIGFIAADVTRDEIERQDKKLKIKVETMRSLQSKSSVLVSQCENEEFRKYVKDLADDFRYSDPVSSSATEQIENELSVNLDTLQGAVIDKDTEAVIALCKKTSALLSERNRICKLNK